MRMMGEEGIVIGDHQQQHGQGEIGVVKRALLADGAKAGSGVRPARSASVIFRWLGMITAKTLAAMMVPMKEPMWMSAPRPEKTWVKP